MLRRLPTAFAVALTFTFAACNAQAQAFPTKPFHVVLPVPPGGLQDSLARALGNELGKRWGQPVVIENRAGGNGIVSGNFVAHSAPDGHTVWMGTVTQLSNDLIPGRSVPFDPAKDLGRVGLAGDWDYVASLYVVNDSISAEVWSRVESRLGPLLDEHPGQVLGGVSTPAVPGVAVKLLARTAPDLTKVFDAMWAAVRAELWNLPPVAWRKY